MAHHVLRVSGTAASLATLGVLASGYALAGPLDPPAGPVVPTMKTLDAVEPRICINDLPGSVDAVHVITEPGNYYLCADVLGEAGKHGIHIDLSAHTTNGCPVTRPVRCSLNGFALAGVPGSDDAIHVSGSVANDEIIYIFGGRGAEQSSIQCWGGDGLEFDSVEDLTVSNLRVTDCAGNGMRTSGSPRTHRAKCFTSFFRCDLSGIVFVPPLGGSNVIEIVDVDCSGNGLHGLDIDFENTPIVGENGSTRITLDSPIFDNNVGDGMRLVRDNRRHSISMLGREMHASGNGGDGVRVLGETIDLDESCDETMDLDGLTASGNGGVGVRITRFISRLKRCVTRSNGEEGVRCVEAPVTAEKCESSENAGGGMYIFGGRASISSGSYTENGGGPGGGTGITFESDGTATGELVCSDLTISDNVGPGMHLVECPSPARLTDIMFSSNAGDALRAESPLGVGSGAVYVYRCTAQGNTGDGFALLSSVGGEVRDSTADGNSGVGVRLVGSGIFVVSNVLSGNTQGPISAAQGNAVGPSVDPTTLATNTNPHANLVR